MVLIDPKSDKASIALFSGELPITARSLACHVLDDGMRVIPRDDIVRSLTDHFERDLASRLKVATRRVDFLIRPQAPTRTHSAIAGMVLTAIYH